MNITRRALWFAGISAVCAMFLVTPGRAHAADPNATYAGTMSDGGAVTLTVSADGKAVAISLRYAPSSVPAGCSAGQTGTPPLASNGSQFGMNNSDAAGGTRAFFSGPDFQSVAGVTTVIPSGGTNCPARYLTWRADRVPATGISGKPAASFTYSGSVSAIGVSETVGTAQITTDANGGISRFVLSATNAGCQYSLGTDAVPVTNGSGDQNGTGGRLSLVVGQVSGSTRVSFGGGFIATGTGSCPTLGGYWVATESGAAPTVTNPTTASSAGQGNFVSTPAFGTGAQALAVFGGGTVAQLEAAAKTAGGTGVWAQDQTGGFVLLVVGGPSFINDAFRAKFSAGLAPNTAVTLTK